MYKVRISSLSGIIIGVFVGGKGLWAWHSGGFGATSIQITTSLIGNTHFVNLQTHLTPIEVTHCFAN